MGISCCKELYGKYDVEPFCSGREVSVSNYFYIFNGSSFTILKKPLTVIILKLGKTMTTKTSKAEVTTKIIWDYEKAPTINT